jgi:hypothetical protein
MQLAQANVNSNQDPPLDKLTSANHTHDSVCCNNAQNQFETGTGFEW